MNYKLLSKKIGFRTNINQQNWAIMRKSITLLSLAVTVSLTAIASTDDKPQFVKNNNVTIAPVASVNTAELYVSAKSSNLQSTTVTAGNYTSPVFFKWGVSEEGYGYPKDRFLLGPCYTDLTWTSTSTNATSIKWSYVDPTTLSSTTLLESTGNSLAVNYPRCHILAPRITASGSNDSTYYYGDLLCLGGSASDVVDGKTYDYGACTYDLSNTTGDTRSTEFCYPDGDQKWTAALSGTFTTVKVLSFGNKFPQPASSYALSKCWVRCYGTVSAGATFTMCLHKIGEDGKINSDTLGIGTATVANDISSSNFVLSFDMKYKDNLLNDASGYMTINSAIYLSLSGFRNDKVTLFQPLWRTGVYYAQGSIIPASVKNAVVGLECEKDGVVTYPSSNATYWKYGTSEPYQYCTDFEFQTDATFPWMTSKTTSITFPKVGGNNTVSISSCFPHSKWTVSGDLNADGVMDSAPWLTYTIDDNNIITFTAGNTTADRSFTAVFTCPGGGSVSINIAQSATDGVKNICAASVSVTLKDGNFIVTAPESVNKVSIYNVSGVLETTASVYGETIINAQNMAKGVYLLRFDNGMTTKIEK